MNRIPVAGPSITQRERDYVADAVANAWYGQHNMYHARFEAAFREYVGRKHALLLPSCTSALHLALLALDVGPGDEVIVPEATWIASAAPVTYVGATTVFADIDPQTWCIDVDSVERLITPRTKAIIPVDVYGSMPDYGRLTALGAKHGIAIIEDAAEAVGSTYEGQAAGRFGAIGVYSFHGSKTLTTGEGGMLVTDDTALFNRVSFLRDHGRPPGDRYFRNTEVGYKYKMSSMQAALGLAQVERIDELITMKRHIFDLYRKGLSGLPVTLNAEPEPRKNSYWMVTIIANPSLGLKKEAMMAEMDAAGIDTRPFFYPLSSLEAFAGQPQAEAAKARNDVSYRITPYGLNLPSGYNLTERDISQVCNAVGAMVERRRPLAAAG